MADGPLIRVTPDPAFGPHRGRLSLAGIDVPCALGPSGITAAKREGDGATPAGRFALRRVLYRPDRLARPPVTGLPCLPLDPADGWSDDPADRRYNCPVRRPHGFSHEALWRSDDLYDIITILGHNDAPPVPGQGSAIFFHLARPDFSPTEGCIAVTREAMLAVLAEARPGMMMEISP
jgi:L,D-peptidoglycan transpeptidase YkuD (ErfK/YbiS/YcfS/YnhG family)